VAPTFAAPIVYQLPGDSTSVAVSDVNGDGIPDIIVGYRDSNQVSVLLGDGDGTFQRPATYSTGPGATNGNFGLAVADVNGDGKPDIVATTVPDDITAAGSLSVLLNNGDGTFGSPTLYTVGHTPTSVAIADVNGDGKPDLIVGNYGDGDYGHNNIGVLLGNGNGTFQTQVEYPTAGGGDNPFSIAVGDLNGDGKLDVVTTNNHDDSVSVLLGNGDGSFQAPISYAAGNGPDYVTIGDVNGDGIPDLFVVDENSNTNTVAVLLGKGDGTFGSPTLYNAPGANFGGAIADINGDGKPDLIAGTEVNILLGKGDGTFDPGIPVSGGANRIAAADLTGNGKTDIVSTIPGGVVVQENTTGLTTETYDVNLTVGTGTVNGWIQTDGHLGVLSLANILDSSLTLTDGSQTEAVGGRPPYFFGTDLTATTTGLFFNFGGSGGELQYGNVLSFEDASGPFFPSTITGSLSSSMLQPENGNVQIATHV